MKRLRLQTLMLLIVIAAQGMALVVREYRAARREAELQARLALAWPPFVKQQQVAASIREAVQWSHKLVELVQQTKADGQRHERDHAAALPTAKDRPSH
jgi:hypothetical protein